VAYFLVLECSKEIMLVSGRIIWEWDTWSQAVARIADSTALQQKRLLPAVFAMLNSKRIGVTTRPIGVTWRHRSCDHSISHRPFPIGDTLKRSLLSPAVFEILGSKRIGVTSLTFRGHVTSSVTWSFDSPYAISYRLSFGTKPLSLNGFGDIQWQITWP